MHTPFIHLHCKSRTKINVYRCSVGLHFLTMVYYFTMLHWYLFAFVINKKYNDRVIWVYNSGEARFGAPFIDFFAVSVCVDVVQWSWYKIIMETTLKSIWKRIYFFVCGKKKMRNLLNWLVLRDFHGEWNENKPAICEYAQNSIVYFYHWSLLHWMKSGITT